MRGKADREGRGLPPVAREGTSLLGLRWVATRSAAALVLIFVTLLLSACVEARVHYTFAEDGSYKVEGSVALLQRDALAEHRLSTLRGRLEAIGVATADLAQPGRTGFTFHADSADDTWLRQQAGGGPRLYADQGLLSKKSVFYWPLDWDTYVEGVVPEGLTESDMAEFVSADIQVTATFPGDGARHNGEVAAGSAGRTVTWTVQPLAPGFLRAEHSEWVGWRVALVPLFVLAAVAVFGVRRYRALRDVPTAHGPAPGVPVGASAGVSPAGVPAGVPVGVSPAGAPLGAPPPGAAGARPPAGAASIRLEGATGTCPVCDAPLMPGEPCSRCVATAEAALDS